MSNTTLYTIGHSNRDSDAFVLLLKTFKITCLVDVRSWPGSKRYPQFNRDALSSRLNAVGIHYVWEGQALGGRRDIVADAQQHRQLSSESMRYYAQHMHSTLFQQAVRRLSGLANQQRTVFMCAEKNPEHCHRSFIADYLTMQGLQVKHILDTAIAHAHVLNIAARIMNRHLIYDNQSQLDLGL